jgi:hypothetical protein
MESEDLIAENMHTCHDVMHSDKIAILELPFFDFLLKEIQNYFQRLFLNIISFEIYCTRSIFLRNINQN